MYRQLKWVLVLVVTLLLTACGSRAESPSSSGSDQVEDKHQDADIELTSEPQGASPSNKRCETPAPVELGLGEPINGVVEEPFWFQCFWVEIPEGVSHISFELKGMSADLNLAVGYGYLVTVQYHIGEFWRPGEVGTTDEVLVIENPAPGPFFITIGPAGPKDPSPFTLGVYAEPETIKPASGLGLPESGTCAFPATEVKIGSTIDSEIVGRDQDPLPRDYFCVQVPEGINSLTIEITGLEDNLEIFVRHTIPGEWMDRSRGGTERSVVIDNPESGAYYIDIVGAYPGAGSPFILSVQSP